MIYGGPDLAAAFRGVRAHTITIAEDFPEDQYGFQPTPEVKTVAGQFAHIITSSGWQLEVHSYHVPFIDFAMFQRGQAERAVQEQQLTSKAAILAALKSEGEAFAQFLDSVSEETLAERVSFPPPLQPSTKTRFEMLLSVKEHEMHHRAQLMVYQRLLGLVPHLTTRRAAARAAAAATVR